MSMTMSDDMKVVQTLVEELETLVGVFQEFTLKGGMGESENYKHDESDAVVLQTVDALKDIGRRLESRDALLKNLVSEVRGEKQEWEKDADYRRRTTEETEEREKIVSDREKAIEDREGKLRTKKGEFRDLMTRKNAEVAEKLKTHGIDLAALRAQVAGQPAQLRAVNEACQMREEQMQERERFLQERENRLSQKLADFKAKSKKKVEDCRRACDDKIAAMTADVDEKLKTATTVLTASKDILAEAKLLKADASLATAEAQRLSKETAEEKEKFSGLHESAQAALVAAREVETSCNKLKQRIADDRTSVEAETKNCIAKHAAFVKETNQATRELDRRDSYLQGK